MRNDPVATAPGSESFSAILAPEEIAMSPRRSRTQENASSSPAVLASTEPAAVHSTPTRIDSIDLLRGVVMVIMMLDHTRDFVHNAALQFDPTNLTKTNIALFLTRWITHFCAPVFVFLAGTSAYLQLARGKSKSELSRFLFTRGVWLIVLEFTVVRFGFTFNLDYRFLGALQVIWVIGVSMIILGALIHLPIKIIAAIGIAMILFHNLLDGYQVQSWRGPGSPVPGLRASLWIILHQPFSALPVFGFPGPVAFVIYPLIPWIGVMATGYSFGTLYQLQPERRRKLLLIFGAVVTLLFVALRGINIYGNSERWSSQKNFLYTVLSFVNTTKYPPSLLFLLMTLGPALLALAWFELNTLGRVGSPALQPGWRAGLRSVFVTFGRVPLFFYILQWLTAHMISLLLHWIAGKPTGWLFESPIGNFNAPPGIGFDLWVVYACWILGVLLLYPLCKWFAGVKQRRRDWWLSYL